MWGRKKKDWELPESAVTDESVYRSRRRFLQALGISSIAGAGLVPTARWITRPAINPTPRLQGVTGNDQYGPVGRAITPADIVFRFNNFYEFTLSKSAAIRRCRNFRLDPWTLLIDGQVREPIRIQLEDILRLPLERRVYRFRCVEAWAMAVPWIGVPLSTLLQRVEPLDSARFITIQSFLDPDQAPRQKAPRVPWPYCESLTLSEAMHPLTLAAVGMYDSQLQPQSGAPLRVVIPWKYGFKGPKSVVRITFTSHRARSFWNTLQPDEYDLVANVDPGQPHPRWSQESEVLLGTWGRRVPTVKYNGYGPWVATLYEGPAGGGENA